MGRRKERNKLNGRRHLISEAVEEGWCHLRVDLLAISWADLKVRRSRGTVICRSIFCQPYFRAVRVVYLVEVALKLDLSPAQPGSLFFYAGIKSLDYSAYDVPFTSISGSSES